MAVLRKPPLEYAKKDRKISVEFHSTPQLYVAYFKDEYDGAPDSHHPMGFGKTKAEAVADLIGADCTYPHCGYQSGPPGIAGTLCRPDCLQTELQLTLIRIAMDLRTGKAGKIATAKALEELAKRTL